MTRSEILQGLKEILPAADGGNKAMESVTEQTRLREDLGLSSLDFMSFLGELEDTYDIEIDLDEAINVHTIGEAVEMMSALAAA